MTEELGRPIRYQAAWTVPFLWHMTTKRGHPLSFAGLMAIEYGIGIAPGHSETLTPTVTSLLGGRPPRTLRAFLQENRGKLAAAP